MNNGQEIEVKFYLADIERFRENAVKAGAELITARVYELNLRFDTPQRDLTQQRRVLRLRKDDNNRITYKGPGKEDQLVAVRQEIEFQVSDFDAAQQLLEALGYEVSIRYEKYRTTFHLMNAEVVLDELPYGNFVEIEAPDGETVQRVAEYLKLDWEARIIDNYLGLFERLKTNLGISADNLSFAELEEGSYSAADLGVKAGDRAEA
jgi:adenylate cyclase, class 2